MDTLREISCISATFMNSQNNCFNHCTSVNLAQACLIAKKVYKCHFDHCRGLLNLMQICLSAGRFQNAVLAPVEVF